MTRLLLYSHVDKVSDTGHLTWMVLDSKEQYICMIDCLLQTDKGFDKHIFEKQMSVMRGQVSLTIFNKIAIQGTPQMAADKEAIILSRVHSYC